MLHTLERPRKALKEMCDSSDGDIRVECRGVERRRIHPVYHLLLWQVKTSAEGGASAERKSPECGGEASFEGDQTRRHKNKILKNVRTFQFVLVGHCPTHEVRDFLIAALRLVGKYGDTPTLHELTQGIPPCQQAVADDLTYSCDRFSLFFLFYSAARTGANVKKYTLC